MERADRDLILYISAFNPRLKELYEQHLELEREVEKYDRYTGYSSSVALHQKQLKKAKLKGMDDIMAILADYRQHQSVAAA